jgi:hypothetical protein
MPSKWNPEKVVARLQKGEAQEKIAKAFGISRFALRARTIRYLGELAGRKSVPAQLRAGLAAWNRMRKEIEQKRAEKLKKPKPKKAKARPARKPAGVRSARKVKSKPKKKTPSRRRRK